MNASILAIGDEIVSGLTVDTNSSFIAQLLRAAGVDVGSILAVPDDPQAITRALARATEDAELIVTTGGLGPTADDLTSGCVAGFVGVPLELHEPSLAVIEARFRERGLEMPENNRKQALLPAGSTPISNGRGTAPGFVCTVGHEQETTIVSLPGVPSEMQPMAEDALLPLAVERAGYRHLGSRTFSVFGLSESKLDELLAGVVTPPEARLSFRAAFPRLQARVSVTSNSPKELRARLDSIELRVRERLGDYLYAVGDEGLEETVGRILRERGHTVAVAESCTGGLIGHRITDVAGSSEYFQLGVVAYSNEAKQEILGVRATTLDSQGAVSEATVLEMARGIRRISGSDYGIATSGIAGPGGGSEEKPVGTVWIALSGPGGDQAHRSDLGSRSRAWIKEMTAQIALDRLRRSLLNIAE